MKIKYIKFIYNFFYIKMSIIENVRQYEIAAKDLYTRSLLSPENFIAKIPGPLPISTATASLRENFSITPNVQGKFLLILDPFSNIGKLYTNDDLNGNGQGTVTNKTFTISNEIVDQFRLVSSSVILRYYGNFNQMSGLFISAVTTDPENHTDFRDFNNIEDLTNKFLSKCIDGVKLIYTPMDNRAIEFRPITTLTNDNHPCKGQYLFIIAGDLFPNNTCIRVDFYRNIEYTTIPRYREYIMQTKTIPCQFELPSIDRQSSIAPSSNNIGSALNNNNIPYELKLLDSASSRGFNINMKSLM